jgi:CheY-like chemotaxis protein
MMPEMDGFDLAEQIRQHSELAGATIMMLSSAGHPGDRARCRELGVSACLTKPIKQSDLLDTIIAVLSRSPVETREPAPKPQLSLPEAHRRLHLLLTEDNTINQRVALGMLKQRGHTVVVASNGKEALAALEREAFDLVLMDVQMPEMDGFETTREIRRRESQLSVISNQSPVRKDSSEESQLATEHRPLATSSKSQLTTDNRQLTTPRIPIIAMTAHAMKGDRERCLAAGMDAYVSKPLEARQLFAVIDSVRPTPVGAESGASGRATPAEAKTGTLGRTAPGEVVFDRDATLDRVDGNRELLREIIGLFFDEIPGLLSTIREMITRCDTRALERAAHTLKGAVGNFSAQGAYAAALRVEGIGRSGDLSHVEEAYAELEKEVTRLSEALTALREENGR